MELNCEKCKTNKSEIDEAIDDLTEMLTLLGFDTPEKLIAGQKDYASTHSSKLTPPPIPGKPISEE